ncbi:MAG TPA: universal stress protein, partial [Actinocatenispora sp.]
MTTVPSPPIVTGVDGSVESLDAVRWAARAAHLRGAPLEIVYAVDFSALLAGGVVPPPEEMKEVLRVRGARRAGRGHPAGSRPRRPSPHRRVPDGVAARGRFVRARQAG